jgi:hypothetical protein
MLPKERLAALVAAVVAGVFFFASGLQTLGLNWAGQSCGKMEGICINPEWMAVGAGCFMIAYFMWKRP